MQITRLDKSLNKKKKKKKKKRREGGRRKRKTMDAIINNTKI
jgi:hypothetical protein